MQDERYKFGIFILDCTLGLIPVVLALLVKINAVNP